MLEEKCLRFEGRKRLKEGFKPGVPSLQKNQREDYIRVNRMNTEVKRGSRDKTSDSCRWAANNLTSSCSLSTANSTTSKIKVFLFLNMVREREEWEFPEYDKLTDTDGEVGVTWGSLAVPKYPSPKRLLSQCQLQTVSPYLLQKIIFWLVREIEKQHKLCTFLKLSSLYFNKSVLQVNI